jgi:hypothetical protein
MSKRLKLPEEGPLPSDLENKTLLIAVTIAYPGSRVSDIRIGHATMPISNQSLRDAARLANKELLDEDKARSGSEGEA